MTPNIADIVSHHVSLEVRCLDRLYLHAYLPNQSQAARGGAGQSRRCPSNVGCWRRSRLAWLSTQWVSGLRFGHPRHMALLQAIIGFTHLPCGSWNRDLRPQVAALLGRPYTAAQMTYDPRRLRLKGQIHRIPSTHRYTTTSYGLKVAFFYAKPYLHIFRPHWRALLPDDDQLPLSLRTALDLLDREITKLHEEAACAA